jgi:hydrogenase nickel incorporation protein HypA/HybF
MHELSVAQNIIEIVQEHLQEDQKDAVKKVKVKVGKLTNIFIDSLIFGFEVLTKETNLAGSELEIEVVPIKIKCEACGENSALDDFLFACPVCQSTSIKIISGYELMVNEIELKD